MIDRLPNSRNPTISVFEVRSIGIEDHVYILLERSIDSLGFGRLWLIRSIFGAMVLGSMLLMTIDYNREDMPLWCVLQKT
jgi:hypothetical protein